jgi:hypothetical protein
VQHEATLSRTYLWTYFAFVFCCNFVTLTRNHDLFLSLCCYVMYVILAWCSSVSSICSIIVYYICFLYWLFFWTLIWEKVTEHNQYMLVLYLDIQCI